MHFGIGLDMAVVLIKAILLSLLSVFTLMPGLLVLFSNLIDKTQHKELLPKITGHRQARCEDPLHRAASVCGAYGVCLLLRQPLPLCLYLQ